MQKKSYKILQLLPTLDYGGVDQGVLQVARHLKRQGHSPLVMSRVGRLTPPLIAEGIDHIPADIGAKNPLKMLCNIRRLKQYIRDTGVDLVHARSRAPAWVGYAATRALKIPFVTTFHGAYGLDPALKKHYNKVMAKADKVIAVSRFIENHVTDNYGDVLKPGALVRIDRGIDVTQFQANSIGKSEIQTLRTLWDVPSHHKIILMPGRVRRIKGHDLVLSAVENLPTDLRNHITLVFLGPADPDDAFVISLKHAMAMSPLKAHVRLVPPTMKMAAAYAASDLVVQGSRWPESFGRTVVEAMAMGTPIIGPNIGAVPELITPETGWLFEAGNVADLTRKISQALPMRLDNEMLNARRNMIQAAMARVQTYYSEARMLDHTTALYTTLIEAYQR